MKSSDDEGSLKSLIVFLRDILLLCLGNECFSYGCLIILGPLLGSGVCVYFTAGLMRSSCTGTGTSCDIANSILCRDDGTFLGLFSLFALLFIPASILLFRRFKISRQYYWIMWLSYTILIISIYFVLGLRHPAYVNVTRCG